MSAPPDPRLAPSPARAAAQAAFLAAEGWARAAIRPLAGDASNRRYLRLEAPSGTRAVLMDSPPAKGEDPRPFLSVTALLRARGLSAPEVLAADPALGFLLLEDLGDALFARVAAAEPALEPTLYAAAGELLAELVSGPGAEALPPYDAAVLAREAALAWEWWRPAATGAPTPPERAAAAAEALAAALRETGAEAARAAPVLRDYHAENLIWLPARRGTARIGLLDYQDALAGHAAYDLISLVEDARRDVSPAAAAAARAPLLPPGRAARAAFEAAAAALAAQRNLKIMGIFARLARRDGKPAYLRLLPRVWGHLRRDLAHPALAGTARALADLPAPDAAALARAAAAPAAADARGDAP